MIVQQMPQVSPQYKIKTYQKTLTHEERHDNTRNTTRYTMYAICKSSKKARYEFTSLLHTYMKLEYRTMPYSDVQ